PSSDDINEAGRRMLEGFDLLAEGLQDERFAAKTLRLIQRLSNVGLSDQADEAAMQYAHDAGADIVTRSLGTIDATVARSRNPRLRNIALEAVADSLRNLDYTDGKAERVNFLTTHLEGAIRNSAEHNDSYSDSMAGTSTPAASMFETILGHSTYDQQQEAINMVDRLVMDGDPRVTVHGAELVERAIASRWVSPDTRADIQDTTIHNLLIAYGINYNEAHERWRAAAGPSPAIYEAKNFLMITELERDRPGISRILTDKKQYGFDLINFARFPHDMLVAQYDQRDNPDLKYVTLATAGADRGTLKEFPWGITDLFYTAEAEGVAVRAYEVQNKLGLHRAWTKAARKYGPMSARVIIAHGSDEALGLGSIPGRRSSNPADFRVDPNNVPDELLSQYDLERLPAQRSLRGISTPDCETVVISCATGADGGVVEQASVTYPDEPFTAPSVSVGIEGLKVTRTPDGDVRVEVDFSSKKPDGEKRRFLGGKVVAAEVIR
ncbi:MAG: hypothetical protein AAB834_04785, partial [Patescibacteria group bacterium]